MFSLVLSILSSWATGPAPRTEARPPNPVVTLGKLLKGRLLLASLKRGMTSEQVRRVLGNAVLLGGDSFGYDVWYEAYGILVSYSYHLPGERPRDVARVRGYRWVAFGVVCVDRDFWEK